MRILLAMLFMGSFTCKGYAQQQIPSATPPFDSVKKAEVPEYSKPAVLSSRQFYYSSLGAACKLEFKFEKATKVPLRLRLGSLQQTDYLERKPNAQKPQ